MPEPLDPWPFVIAAYAIGGGASFTLAAWSWWAMRVAEARRDATRRN